MNTKELIRKKKTEKIKKIQNKIKELNITYDEYIKKQNYNKNIIEINNNLKNIEEKIKKIDLNKKEFN